MFRPHLSARGHLLSLTILESMRLATTSGMLPASGSPSAASFACQKKHNNTEKTEANNQNKSKNTSETQNITAQHTRKKRRVGVPLHLFGLPPPFMTKKKGTTDAPPVGSWETCAHRKLRATARPAGGVNFAGDTTQALVLHCKVSSWYRSTFCGKLPYLVFESSGACAVHTRVSRTAQVRACAWTFFSLLRRFLSRKRQSRSRNIVYALFFFSASRACYEVDRPHQKTQNI